MSDRGNKLDIVPIVAHPEAVSWEAREIASHVLRANFYSGPAECYAATVEIVEDTDTYVSIALRVGFHPEHLEDCIAIALNSYVDIPLENPLKGREVRRV